MEHAAGATHLQNKGLTYVDICDLTVSRYQEAKGVGKWPSVTHAKESKASHSTFTQAKVHAFVQCFQKVRPLPSHMARAVTLVIFVERKNIGPTNV